MFDLLVVVFEKLVNKNMIRASINNFNLLRNGAVFRLVMVIIDFLLYSPLVDISGNGFIMIVDPLNVQLAKIGIYSIFFMAGVLIGGIGLENIFWGRRKHLQKYILYLSYSILFVAILSFSLTFFTSGKIITIGAASSMPF